MKLSCRSFPGVFLLSFLLLVAGCASKRQVSVPQEKEAKPAELGSEAYHHYTNAVIMEQEGLAAEAIREYEKALSYEPLSYDVRMALGQLCFRLKRPQDAINMILPIPDKNTDTYLLIGDCYQQLGRYRQAQGAYEQALAAEPDNVAASYQLGRLALQQENLEEAAGYYKAAAFHSRNPDLYEQAAKIYARLGISDSTIACFEMALKAGGSNPALYSSLAYYYSIADEIEKAKQTLRKGIDIYPFNARLQSYLIDIYDHEDNV
ncbi:MAG: tetratricopeptide repeat protein, partial [candidate division Zixibacteria bacterium]|nr:tetratricopeptide repeat protein [candidate division Zixibacteria bacterium]